LAVLGYLSLRRWQASADLLFREQARDMATMAAEKIEMAIAKSEEESLGGLQRVLLASDFGPAAIEAWKASAPLVEHVALVDRAGRVEYQEPGAADPAIVAKLLAELSPSFWERGGRRHFAVGDGVLLAAVLQGNRGPVLAVIGRSDEVMRREGLAKTLARLEGQNALPIPDPPGRAVSPPQPTDADPGLAPLNPSAAPPPPR